MKSLRTTTLMLLSGAFSICVVPAHAQQEVDPDHFEQPTVASTHVRRTQRQHHLTATAAHRNNKKLAGAASQKSGPQKNARQATGNPDVVVAD